MKKVLFVCLGNICRSPAAEGVFLSKLSERNLEGEFLVDSAGTSAYHSGARADERMISHAEKRGFDLASRSRKLLSQDFDKFDYIIAMDLSDLRNMQEFCGDRKCLAQCLLMTDFCRKFEGAQSVPDPYYG